MSCYFHTNIHLQIKKRFISKVCLFIYVYVHTCSACVRVWIERTQCMRMEEHRLYMYLYRTCKCYTEPVAEHREQREKGMGGRNRGGGGGGGQKRGRTQRRDFKDGRENTWKKKPRDLAQPQAEDGRSGGGEGWEPFLTDNPVFQQYYKVSFLPSFSLKRIFFRSYHTLLPSLVGAVFLKQTRLWFA